MLLSSSATFELIFYLRYFLYRSVNIDSVVNSDGYKECQLHAKGYCDGTSGATVTATGWKHIAVERFVFVWIIIDMMMIDNDDVDGGGGGGEDDGGGCDDYDDDDDDNISINYV